MRAALVLLFALLASPAWAQFPPPGVYKCTFMDGGVAGVLTLFAAGDYQFDAQNDGTSGSGQVASAGTDVTALSGPLFDAFHLSGSFATDDRGEARFAFDSDQGAMYCGAPTD